MTYDEASSGGRTHPADELYPGRRQLYDLTADDLRAHGVWWFPGPDGHLSGPDDQTVMPLDTSAALPDGSVQFPPGRFLVRTTFRLAGGGTLTGHLTYTPDGGDGLRDREPTLCVPGGQVPLWHGLLVPAASEAAAWLERVGLPREQVFPLTWSADFHPPGDDLSGSAEGFMAWKDGHPTAC